MLKSTSLSIVRHLQGIITGLRNELQTYTFPTQEDEIRFFKVQKPELLGRLLYFHKICRIEMQCPNGSNEVIRKHLIAELDNLTYFFNRNLDFYQYYRSHSTMYDKYYFVRGKADIRLCADSAQFDKDPNISSSIRFMRPASEVRPVALPILPSQIEGSTSSLVLKRLATPSTVIRAKMGYAPLALCRQAK